MAVGRRFLGGQVRLAQRSWEDVAPELEFFLNRLAASEANGIPAGFNGVVPDEITGEDLGSAGNMNSGWAAADHEHPIDVDSVVERALAFAFLGY